MIALIKYIPDERITILVALFLAIWTIYKHYFDNKVQKSKIKGERVQRLSLYLSSEIEKPRHIETAVIEEWDRLAFEEATGIYVSRSRLQKLLGLYDKLNPQITWRTISSAQSYLETDSTPEVKVSASVPFLFIIFMSVWIIYTFFGFIIAIALMTSNGTGQTFNQAILFLALVVGIWVFSIHSVPPTYQAWRIKKLLDKKPAESKQPD